MKATIYIGRGTPTVTIARAEIELPAPGEAVTVAASEGPTVLAWDPDMCLSAKGYSVTTLYACDVTPWRVLAETIAAFAFEAWRRRRDVSGKELASAASAIASRQLRGALAGIQALIRIEEGVQDQPERAGDLAAYQRAAAAIEETLAIWPGAEDGRIRTALWR